MQFSLSSHRRVSRYNTSDVINDSVAKSSESYRAEKQANQRDKSRGGSIFFLSGIFTQPENCGTNICTFRSFNDKLAG